MIPYEIIEHTADIGIKAYGEKPEELFINAAKGMFSIIADSGRINKKEKIEITLEADSYDELLREWLKELLYRYNVTGVVFSEFKIGKLTPTAIQAQAFGSKAKPDEIKSEIKAVTYHELEFKKTPRGYEAKVIFDV